MVDKEDRTFWQDNKNGVYTVQSGYGRIWRKKQNKTEAEQQEDSTSYTNPKSPIWKVLWKVLVKHKLKVFMWKCLSEGLLVNELIWRRMHKGDPYCKGCGKGWK